MRMGCVIGRAASEPAVPMWWDPSGSADLATGDPVLGNAARKKSPTACWRGHAPHIFNVGVAIRGNCRWGQLPLNGVALIP